MFGVEAPPVTIGRFAVLETVGAGGMGVVYAAYDEELDRRVAVKLLSLDRERQSSVGKRRLLREAQALAKLSHPNVVQVYETGMLDERVFVAMEFLPGPTLREWLLETRRPWSTVLKPFVEAGEGLAAAHREGIIHRDFKPANVLFGGDGRVRVVDFGLARASGSSHYDSVDTGRSSEALQTQAFHTELTLPGVIMGTPAYMAPEQARQEGVDERSDQFSFCVALYEALFGCRPHTGRSPYEVMSAVASGDVVAPPRSTKVPARIVRAVMRGLRLDPAERFSDMDALLAELSVRSRSGWKLAGAGALVSFGLIAVALPPSSRCTSFEAEIGQAWAEPHDHALRSAFDNTGAPQAARLAERAVEQLDTYSNAWAQARREVCETHEQQPEPSSRLYDEQLVCLHERKAELAALVQVLSDATAEVVEQAPRAVAQLSTVAECLDLSALYLQVSTTSEPTNEPLRIELAAVRAKYLAGLYEPAIAETNAIIEAARKAGDLAIEAQAFLQLGLIEQQRWAFGPAASAMEQALDLAERAAADRVSGRAWVRLAEYQARLGKTELAQYSIRRARAKVLRLDHNPELWLELLGSESMVMWRGGQRESAVEEQIDVVDRARTQYGESDPRTLDAQLRLANMWSELERHEDAQIEYQRVRRGLEQAYGPQHPKVATLLEDIAVDHHRAGHYDEARKSFLDAQQIFIEVGNARSPALLNVYMGLVDIALRSQALDQAQVALDNLFAVIEHADVSSADQMEAWSLKAELASTRGDYETAVHAARESIELANADRGTDVYRESRCVMRQNLGHWLFMLGRPAEAQVELGQALEELDTPATTEDMDVLRLELLRANIFLWLGLSQAAEGKPARSSFEQGLRIWGDARPATPQERVMQAKLRWALARELQIVAPGRAHQLSRNAQMVLGAKALDESLAPTRDGV